MIEEQMIHGMWRERRNRKGDVERQERWERWEREA